MDLVFAAEQYAQAQAAIAAAAAAQFYANVASNSNVAPEGSAAAAPFVGIDAIVSSAAQMLAVASTVQQGTTAGLLPAPSGAHSLTEGTSSSTTTTCSRDSRVAPPPPAISASSSFGNRSPIGGEDARGEPGYRKRSRSRDKERRKRSRDRDRDPPDHDDRDREYDERKRRGDRERSSHRRDRHRDRRDRRYQNRSRSRERHRRDRSWSPPSSRWYRDRTPDSEDEDWRCASPKSTLVVKGLAPHVDEADLAEDIEKSGLVAVDVRLIRRKGASRGVAFIEFAKVEEAQKWMEDNQGTLSLKDPHHDHQRAMIRYCQDAQRSGYDWSCSKCGFNNFRRRNHCYQCGDHRGEDGGLQDAADQLEVSTYPTSTVLLRGLDALTTEDSVLACLMKLTSLPIKSIKVGRDPVTRASLRVCHVEMNSVADSVFLHNQLIGEPPCIDDKLVSVCYLRTSFPPLSTSSSGGHGLSSSSTSAAASTALEAALWSNQSSDRAGQHQQYTEEEIERLAEYSATAYAKNDQEKAFYKDYYLQYYRDGGSVDGSRAAGSKAPALTEPADRRSSSSSKPDGGSKEQQVVAQTLGKVVVDGVEYQKYPTPDVTAYVYEESSGYYYDATTSLYYDANSRYYFNSATNQYVYWSSEHQTFLPAPGGGTAPPPEGEKPGQDKKPCIEKKDKVKTAKRIAKDMEKWAKALNQKKDVPSSSARVAAPPPPTETVINIGGGGGGSGSIRQGAEDIAFSMLQQQRFGGPGRAASHLADMDDPDEAARAGGPSSAKDEDDNCRGSSSGGRDEESSALTDWDKLACLLCKRQFPSAEKLQKHNQMSDLHKENLAIWRRDKGGPGPSAATASAIGTNEEVQYRDRAMERRKKYGTVDAVDAPGRSNQLKESYLKAVEEAESMGLPEQRIRPDNIGSKMLQKMGWKEGLGLGKGNQGRTQIVETERRAAQVGLGIKSAATSTDPNDTYQDRAKKAIFHRFLDME